MDTSAAAIGSGASTFDALGRRALVARRDIRVARGSLREPQCAVRCTAGWPRRSAGARRTVCSPHPLPRRSAGARHAVRPDGARRARRIACAAIWTALAVAHFQLTGEDRQRSFGRDRRTQQRDGNVALCAGDRAGMRQHFRARSLDGDLRQASLERGNAIGDAALWLLVAGAYRLRCPQRSSMRHRRGVLIRSGSVLSQALFARSTQCARHALRRRLHGGCLG